MIDVTPHRGCTPWGSAYRFMLENDAHAPGSVDRVLVERMVHLCAATAEYLYTGHTPTVVAYRSGTRPELEAHLEGVLRGRSAVEDRVDAIARFCASLGERAQEDLDAMQIGGTEEEVISRGSDWCTDVARVGCILCQIADIPSRIVMLADTENAYSGHVIIEAHRDGSWGAVDVSTDVVYRHPDGHAATTWELMNHPPLVEAHRSDDGRVYTRPRQFRAAAVANYFVADHDEHDYTVSGLNAYYRSILEMSSSGWPGGLRWLHGEDSL